MINVGLPNSNTAYRSLFQQTNSIILHSSISALLHFLALARTSTTITFFPCYLRSRICIVTDLVRPYLFLGPAIFSSNAYNGGPLHSRFLTTIAL